MVKIPVLFYTLGEIYFPSKLIREKVQPGYFGNVSVKVSTIDNKREKQENYFQLIRDTL